MAQVTLEIGSATTHMVKANLCIHKLSTKVTKENGRVTRHVALESTLITKVHDMKATGKTT